MLFSSLLRTGHILDSDSILRPALDFYGKQNKPSRAKMLTHFFNAIYLCDINKNEVALIEYDKSIETGEAIKDHYYTGMAHTNKGIVYSWDCVGQEELECTKKGYEITKLSGDTVKIMYALHMYGLALVHNNLHELADKELKEALKLAKSLNDTVSITKINLSLAQNAIYGGDLTSGKAYYEDAFQYDPDALTVVILDYGAKRVLD